MGWVLGREIKVAIVEAIESLRDESLRAAHETNCRPEGFGGAQHAFHRPEADHVSRLDARGLARRNLVSVHARAILASAVRGIARARASSGPTSSWTTSSSRRSARPTRRRLLWTAEAAQGRRELATRVARRSRPPTAILAPLFRRRSSASTAETPFGGARRSPSAPCRSPTARSISRSMRRGTARLRIRSSVRRRSPLLGRSSRNAPTLAPSRRTPAWTRRAAIPKASAAA